MGRKTSLSLLVAPAILSVAVLSALFLFYNNTSAISDHSLSLYTNTTTLESTINTIPDETITIQKHELTINTDNPNGAKLFISSKDNKTTPAYVTGSGPGTGSGSTGTSAIAESTGTIFAPTKLSPNSFGFALDKNSSTIASNFSTNAIYESTNNTDKLTAKFTKLSNMHNLTEIHNISTIANNNKLSVYYGTNTNSMMREGEYEMDILYTIVSNTPTTNIPENNTDTIENNPKLLLVRENQTFYKDNTITIKTNIKANTPINPTDISIKINNKSCTNITISQNFEQNISKTLELTCKAPQNPATQAGSKYDLNLTVSKYNISTTKKNAINYIIPTPMQTFQYSQCISMNEHEEKLMIDTRDDELYTMAKLKDGKCWMTQNLRLKLSTGTALTPSTSDVSSSWTPPRSTDTASCQRGVAWNQDFEGTKTVRSCYQSESTYNTNGVYYTHTTATAGTTANMNNDGDEATGSICPKGWRLPKARNTSTEPTNNDFYQMAKHYVNSNMTWNTNGSYGYWNGGTHNLLSSPQNFIYSGYKWDDADGVGFSDVGFWWSSTVRSSYRAHNLQAHSVYVSPRNDYSRNFGFTVRCVAREPQTIGSIEYMQDMTPEHCANSTEHQTATLKDKRDNNTYTVAKLKDGKCWMTQNLRLKLDTSTPLKPTDSDVTQNWTPNHSTETTLTGLWDQDPEGDKTVRSYYDSTKSEYGVYYTHTAATAGTIANMNNDGDEATGSICPKGWRLPKTGTASDSPNNDFYNLSKEYKGSATWDHDTGFGGYWNGSYQMLSGEPKYVLSGGRDSHLVSLYGTGSDGYYWSSTIQDGYNAYIMYLYSSYIYPREGNGLNLGANVRCVAR